MDLCQGPPSAASNIVRAMDLPPSAPMTSPLGEFIRRQRELQELSMRQLADLFGISNPYLSQIERGLREPSEKVLEAIAENLELSADGCSSVAAATARRRTGDEPAVVRRSAPTRS